MKDGHTDLHTLIAIPLLVGAFTHIASNSQCTFLGSLATTSFSNAPERSALTFRGAKTNVKVHKAGHTYPDGLQETVRGVVGDTSMSTASCLARKLFACAVVGYAAIKRRQQHHCTQTYSTSVVEAPATTAEPNVKLGMVGAVIMMMCIGSPFTWSVFLQPIQTLMGLSRANASLAFSLFLFWLAIGVWRSGREMGKYSSPLWALMTLALGGGGLVLAGTVGTPPGLFFGFTLTGIAAGMGYSFAVQTAALSKRRGLCTGILLSSFATAPVFLLPIVKKAIAAGGPLTALCQLGGFLLAAAPVVFLTTKLAGVQFAKPSADAGSVSDSLGVFIRIFIAFLCAVFAGLMFFGHASGIMAMYGVKNLAVGLTGMALGNWTGRLVSGTCIDQLGARKILLAGSIGTALATAGLVFSGGLVPPRLVVAVVGAGYGFALTGFTALTAELYGKERFGRIYGKIFIAFGFAGLGAPWLAGKLFDMSGAYSLTIKLVSGLSLMSTVLVKSLPKDELAQCGETLCTVEGE